MISVMYGWRGMTDENNANRLPVNRRTVLSMLLQLHLPPDRLQALFDPWPAGR